MTLFVYQLRKLLKLAYFVAQRNYGFFVNHLNLSACFVIYLLFIGLSLMYCLAYFVFEYTVFVCLFVCFFFILFIFVLDVSPVLHCSIIIKKKLQQRHIWFLRGMKAKLWGIWFVFLNVFLGGSAGEMVCKNIIPRNIIRQKNLWHLELIISDLWVLEIHYLFCFTENMVIAIENMPLPYVKYIFWWIHSYEIESHFIIVVITQNLLCNTKINLIGSGVSSDHSWTSVYHKWCELTNNHMCEYMWIIASIQSVHLINWLSLFRKFGQNHSILMD